MPTGYRSARSAGRALEGEPAIREALLNLVDHEQTIHRLTEELEHARLTARSALWRRAGSDWRNVED